MRKGSSDHSKLQHSRKSIFLSGMRDGIPIGLGYLAVAFSLGIAARNAGISVLQGFIASLFTSASAGEYAVFTSIGVNATLWEIAIITLITNARYLLMSCALSQRLDERVSLPQRLLMGFGITDEIFGVSIAQEGVLSPFYTYGAMTASIPLWALGTSLGIFCGEILPARIVSALSVALYGMFLAIIIPPSKKSKAVAITVLSGFILSSLMHYCPIFDGISSGFKTIILTVLIASAAALLAPIRSKGDDSDERMA